MDADLFAALGGEQRRKLLASLARRGPATATTLARAVPVTRQAVLKHLTALERAGLVRRDREGREVRFQVLPAPLGAVARWIEMVSDRSRARLERVRGTRPRLRGVRVGKRSRRGVRERRRGRR